MSGPHRVWVVTSDDGHLGLFATKELAEQHAARMGDAEVEWDIVRTQPMFDEAGNLNFEELGPVGESVDRPTPSGAYTWLSEATALEQANVLAIVAERAQRGTASPAVIAGLILHLEKLDPTVRAQREAIQTLCRGLLAHLDEGSR